METERSRNAFECPIIKKEELEDDYDDVPLNLSVGSSGSRNDSWSHSEEFSKSSMTLYDEHNKTQSSDKSIKQESASDTEQEEEGSNLDPNSQGDFYSSSSPLNMFEPEVNIEALENEEDLVFENESSADECPSPDDADDDFLPTSAKRTKSPINNDREKPYQCHICEKYFLTPSAKNGHLVKVHGVSSSEETFNCDLCNAPYGCRSNLKRHLIRKHKVKVFEQPELWTRKCSHCGRRFSSFDLVYAHIREEHPETLSEYYQCEWCPALMKFKASLIRHSRRAHSDKPIPFVDAVECAECGMAFANKLILFRHRRELHPKTRQNASQNTSDDVTPGDVQSERKEAKKSVHACKVCEIEFESKRKLCAHNRSVHPRPLTPEFRCRFCGLVSTSALMNKRHYIKVHKREREKIHCGKCNITFSTPEECNKHRETHPVFCEFCNKSFLRQDTLREHRMIHYAPKYHCPHCEKKFTQQSNLRRHIRIHTGEKPYKCSHCLRRFSDKSACSSHERIHTGGERFPCVFCGTSFSKKQRLNYHTRIHTGQGLLYCTLCARPCTTSFAFRKHMETHELPLKKALISLGFQNLLDSDPNFVSRAIMELTQVTILNLSRHSNIPNSFLEEKHKFKSDVSEFPISIGPETAGVSLSSAGAAAPKIKKESMVDESEPTEQSFPETDTVRIKKEVIEFEMANETEINERGVLDGPRIENIKQEEHSESPKQLLGLTNVDSSTDGGHGKPIDPYKNVVEFLQSLLEKESLRMHSKKSRRRQKRSHDESRSTSDSGGKESGDEKMPPTSDFAQRCLEIIMDEAHDREDNEENPSSTDKFPEDVTMKLQSNDSPSPEEKQNFSNGKLGNLNDSGGGVSSLNVSGISESLGVSLSDEESEFSRPKSTATNDIRPDPSSSIELESSDQIGNEISIPKLKIKKLGGCESNGKGNAFSCESVQD